MNLETSMEVTKVVTTRSDASHIAATLRGQKTVVLEGCDNDEYDTEDIVEISMTVKVHSPATLKALGLGHTGTKILALKDRDERLQSFGFEAQPATPGRDGSLSEYDGLVPVEVIDNIRKDIEELA